MNARKRSAQWALVVGLLLFATGCVASDSIVKLPPPQGLVDLRQLESNLDYVDPDDGRSTYVPNRTAASNTPGGQ